MELQQKKDASAPTSINASSSTNNKIAQKSGKSQAPKSKKAHKPKKNKLSMKSSVYSLAVKFYDEQIPNGPYFLKDAIEKVDKTEFQVLMMCHYKDVVSDGIWDIAAEKRHFHLIVRCVNRKKRFRIEPLLNSLGVFFRHGTDDELLENRGIETVGNFQAYANYLIHQTEQAVADGKAPYSLDEIITNLSRAEVEQVLDGYIKVSEKRKVTEEEMISLDKMSYDLGYNLKGFNQWYMSLPLSVRSHAKMRIIKESYNMGLNARILEEPIVNRTCIFIQGPPNTGKTYACKQILKTMSHICVDAGKTGAFDNLTADSQAILIDDAVCPNLLNLSDNYVCHAYRRGSNNPPWTGKYLIVTSNLSFEEWLLKCGVMIFKKRYLLRNDFLDSYDFEDEYQVEHSMQLTTEYKAIRTRFNICKLKEENGVNHLAIKKFTTRGDYEALNFKRDIMIEFKENFDKIIANYPRKNIVSNDTKYDKYIEK